MLERFYPSKECESTYQIDFEKYYKEGYRGVLFDIDNTLVPHGAPADEAALALFAKLKELGIGACVISNNKEPRVKSFAESVGCEYVYKADKPSTRGYNKGMSMLKTERDNTLFVGDQLFTDVYGANRAGMHTILVKPIHPKEEIQIVLKRYLEKIVLYFYHKQVLSTEENKPKRGYTRIK